MKLVILFNCLFFMFIPVDTFSKNSPQCGIEKFKKYQLEYCFYQGKGPLLVLEAPMGDGIKRWPAAFLKKLNQFARILIYNRTGVDSSYFYKKNTADFVTAKSVGDHLHQLLNRLHINQPFILVAHSIGGIYAQYYARNYPQSLAGLVLIDASSTFEPKKNSPFETKTPLKKGSIAYLESKGFHQSMDQVNASPSFPQIPLLVITATNHGGPPLIEEQWNKLQKLIAKQSKKGSQIIAQGSGHYIYNDKPDVVVDEIYRLIKTNQINQ